MNAYHALALPMIGATALLLIAMPLAIVWAILGALARQNREDERMRKIRAEADAAIARHYRSWETRHGTLLRRRDNERTKG